MSSQIRLNRSRSCSICGRTKFRIQLPAPKPDDADYKVAVCPTCDMTHGKDTPRDR